MKRWLTTLRNVVVLLATAAAFVVSFNMLRQVIGNASPWLGLLGMFYLMGLAKSAEPLFLLKMPFGLGEVRPWEKQGTVYARLRVPAFGWFLRNTPFRYFNAAVYIAKTKSNIVDVYRHAEAAEADHFWATLLFTPYIGYVWLSGQPGIALLFVLVQLGFNVYPIMHLRMVRGRLGPVVTRALARAASRRGQ